MLLIAMGALFALLFIVNSILRAAQGREKVSFSETLLAFLALILPLLALVNNNASEQPLLLVNTAAIGIAVAVIVAGIVTLLVEQRKPGRKLNQRRSLLGLGVGALLIVATFIVPMASQLITTPSVGAFPGAAPSGSIVNIADTQPGSAGEALTPPQGEMSNRPAAIGGGTAPENQVALAPTNTLNAAVVQLSATPTRLPSATPTPTNTPYLLLSPTPGTTTYTPDTATGTTEDTALLLASDCWGLVNYNLNLRSGPGMDYSRILTIPYSTTVNVSGRNEDSTWWSVTYETETGWVDGEYLALTGDCADLPVQAPS
jgi:hypothetical protein